MNILVIPGIFYEYDPRDSLICPLSDQILFAMFSYSTSTQAWPLSPQQEQLSMNEGERMEGGKRSQTKNVMPVSARMILQHHEEEGPFQVCGVEVGMVAMAVQVRQVVKGDTSISYTVEDDTGRMEAVHYHDERTIPAMKNTFVKIVGVLKTGREQNMVTVYRLSTITDGRWHRLCKLHRDAWFPQDEHDSTCRGWSSR